MFVSDTLWAGRILRVDLTRGLLTHQPTSDHALALGGRGIGQSILFDEVPPDAGALDPANVITLGAGPLTGTLAPGGARLSVDTKNALTGGVCASNGGGHFAPELKYAGFDAVVITGQAPQPVYLWLCDGQAELRPPTICGGWIPGKPRPRCAAPMVTPASASPPSGPPASAGCGARA